MEKRTIRSKVISYLVVLSVVAFLGWLSILVTNLVDPAFAPIAREIAPRDSFWDTGRVTSSVVVMILFPFTYFIVWSISQHSLRKNFIGRTERILGMATPAILVLTYIAANKIFVDSQLVKSAIYVPLILFGNYAIILIDILNYSYPLIIILALFTPFLVFEVIIPLLRPHEKTAETKSKHN